MVFLVRLAVTAGLLYWLIANVDLTEVRRTFALVQPHHILVSFALVAMALFLGGVRWWLLLHHAAGPILLARVLPSYYLGIFFNNFLPTTIGGDAVRVLHMRMHGLNAKTLIGSAIMDRVIGLIGVIVMGASTVVVFPSVANNTSLRVIMIVTLVISLGALLLFLATPFTKLVNKLVIHYRHTKRRRWLLELASLCQSYAQARGRLLAAFVLTLGLQTALIVTYYILGSVIGIALPLTTYFAIVPAVFIAGSLPISLGGLGVREGALVTLLVAANTEPHLAIGLSILFLLVLWATSLPGVFVLLLPNRNKNPTAEVQ